MRFAFCNEAYGDWSFERICADLAECGYAGIEIAPYTLADDPRELHEPQAARFGEVARRAGLEIVGFHWLLVKPDGLHLTTPDVATRRRTVEFLVHLTRSCAAMGGGVMVLGSPKQRDILEGVTREAAFRRAADACREVCEVAGPLGVTLAIEPLSAVHTNFVTGVAEAVTLIEAVDHPACRLNLDVIAMSSEDRPIAETIAAGARHLAHFQANDPCLGGPGSGTVDFVPVATALERCGYEGWVSVEVFDYTPGGPAIARSSIACLEQAWRDASEG